MPFVFVKIIVYVYVEKSTDCGVLLKGIKFPIVPIDMLGISLNKWRQILKHLGDGICICGGEY